MRRIEDIVRDLRNLKRLALISSVVLLVPQPVAALSVVTYADLTFCLDVIKSPMYVMDDPTQRRSGEHIAIFNACDADIYVPVKKITQGTTLCEITLLPPNTKKNVGMTSFEYNQSYIPLGASDAGYGAFLQCEREMTYVENYKCNENLLACWARN